MEGVPICTYGKLKIDPISKKYSVIPELIIGNKHESILSFLDKELISLATKYKALSIVGSALFIGHALYHNAYKQKTEVELEMENFKQK